MGSLKKVRIPLSLDNRILTTSPSLHQDTTLVSTLRTTYHPSTTDSPPDIVLWDSHPLALGATPQQVWIDGVPQLAAPHTADKPAHFQRLPQTPNFDKEAKEALKYEGLPPLGPKASVSHTVVFANASTVFLRDAEGTTGIKQIVPADSPDAPLSIVVKGGKIVCAGSATSACALSVLQDSAKVEYVDLEGGSIAPGLTTFGSPLGLEEIMGELSTKDGYVLDPLQDAVPKVVGGNGALIHAIDGLQFGTRHALYAHPPLSVFTCADSCASIAYRAGVTTGIVAPASGGFLSGVSTAFSLAAPHKLADGAIVQESGAVHVAIHPMGVPSVSTQIAALRRLLLHSSEGDAGVWFDKVKNVSPAVLVTTYLY